MRALLLSLLMLAAVVLAPASANARPVVGISENNPQLFADPHFSNLLVTTTRLVMAYNAVEAAAKGDTELSDRVIPYLDAAKNAENTDVLVALEHARGDATICNRSANRRLAQCRLPSPAEYERNLRALLTLRPDIHTIAPWNEVNHFTQPTSRNPRAAAHFTDIATRVCKELKRKCTIVAADVLDQANGTATSHPTYTSTQRYLKKFRKALKSKRTICGIHNYSDVNRFRTTGVLAIKKSLKCKSYWLTETGGFYKFASFWTKPTKKAGKCKTNATCQLAAVKFLFKHFSKDRTIKRIYLYTWFSGAGPVRFDAGLVQGAPGGVTVPRKAYNYIKKFI